MIIDWKTIKELHVNKKMEQIVGQWFDLDFFYVDEQGRIQNDFKAKDYTFFSHFFKVQMGHNYGQEWLEQDVEKIFENIRNEGEMVFEYKTFFPHVHGMVAKVVVDGELLGAVCAYPFLKNDVTEKELGEVVKHMVECGLSEVEAKASVSKMRKLFPRERGYMKEMLDIVSDEVGTFHEEISKREARIHELSHEVGNKYRYHNLIGKSKRMQQIYHLLQKINSSEATILIQGENGTGK